MCCIWMGYCIFEIANPSGVLEAWILSRGLIFNGFIIVIITSLLCTRYSFLKSLIFCLSLFTLLAITKTFMQKYIGFDSFETKWLKEGELRLISYGPESAISLFSPTLAIWGRIWEPPLCSLGSQHSTCAPIYVEYII